MSDLDRAMKQHMAYIVHEEGRPFSYRDFMHFQVDGIEHEMTHGAFRNKMSRLRKDGVIQQCYHSVLAFYTLDGVKFRKPITPYHPGVPASNSHPIVRIIRSLPFDKAALHDIHLRFDVRGCWDCWQKEAKSKPKPKPMNPIQSVRIFVCP